MTQVFYSNIDPARKNYLVVSITNGHARIVHDCLTDDELGEVADFYDFAAISGLEVGESCKVEDGSDIVVRIA